MVTQHMQVASVFHSLMHERFYSLVCVADEGWTLSHIHFAVRGKISTAGNADIFNKFLRVWCKSY